MLKKKIVCLAFGFMVCMMGAAGAQAQEAGPDDISPEMLAELHKEPPLSQADINVFIKIVPSISKVAKDDPEAAVAIYTAAGLSETRFALVFTKISLGMLVVNGVSLDYLKNDEQMPEVLLPTEADIALLNKNKDRLEQAFALAQ